MRKTYTNVQPILVRAYCDKPKCGGEIVSTGHGVTRGWSTLWTNKCTVCGKVYDLDTSYPTETYEEIPGTTRPAPEEVECPNCQGTGEVNADMGTLEKPMLFDCERCKGEGTIYA